MSESPPEQLTVVHATGAWVVVCKPAGLLSVPGKGPDKADCVASRVAAMFPHAFGPLVVHRLDMDTSGLMVLGLTPDAQRELSRQFEHRHTEKRYVALVDGLLDAGESGRINAPMRLDPDYRPYQVIDREHGRPASTRWRLLSHETDRTRIHLHPLTGRTHQLRLHCAAHASDGGLGRAILGDVLYGSGYRSPRDPGRLAPAPRLMLHACNLSFTDPDSGRRKGFASAPPF